MEPPPEKMRQDIAKARKHMAELRLEVKGLQTQLRQFNASMRGNVSEFEKWQETFNTAAANTEKTANEYVLSMFLQYNLLGSLERSVQKNAFANLDQLINTSDPKMRLWLGKQLKNRHVELSVVQKTVDIGKLSGDFAAFLSKEPDDTTRNLDALLLVNDLLEIPRILPWKASPYFEQAKAIGETYTDLAAFAFSCAKVRQIEKTTSSYNREISYLSTKAKESVKEMRCLDRCLDAYTDRCVDRCMGKSRFGTAPPLPR
jgi:phage shock protein A